MKCYNYKNDTKEYISDSNCPLDPLESKKQGKSIWSLPANSTFVVPPSSKEGYAIIFNNNAWEYIEDNRGKIYWLSTDSWDSEPHVMKDLGALPEGYLLERPEKPLELQKEDKLQELSIKFLEAENNGTIDSSVGFSIDATERSKRDIDGLIELLEATKTETTSFCAADNSFHDVNLEQLKAMKLEVIKYGQELYQKKWTYREQINNSKDKEELNKIDIKF